MYPTRVMVKVTLSTSPKAFAIILIDVPKLPNRQDS